MPSRLAIILDDRAPPPAEIEAILGQVRFSGIIRKRKRLADQIAEIAEPLADDVILVRQEEQLASLRKRIEDQGAGCLYLRLPTSIAPLNIAEFGTVIEKARFALESMFLTGIQEDDAPMVLTPPDALSVLVAASGSERRTVLLGLAERVPRMVDHIAMVDLRRPDMMLRFLSGATEARQFNVTTVEAGLFRKSSDDVDKMRREYRFFHVAPEPMKRFLMPTFDFWEDKGRAGYAMEHLTVPDAAVQFLHRAFSPVEFDRFLDQFFDFLASRETGPRDRTAMAAAARQQILDKMRSRIARFLAMPEGTRLNAILAASGPAGDLTSMRTRSEALLEKAFAKDRSDRLAFSHGDACFSNILFDRRLGLLRLIDPRGAEAPGDAMMHPLYDVAKFSHSVLGGYDYVNNDLFTCVLEDGVHLRLQLDDDGPPAWAGAMFTARLGKAGFDPLVTRTIELSFFMSMLPLHTDHPRKLAGFALVAADLIRRLEEASW